MTIGARFLNEDYKKELLKCPRTEGSIVSKVFICHTALYVRDNMFYNVNICAYFFNSNKMCICSTNFGCRSGCERFWSCSKFKNKFINVVEVMMKYFFREIFFDNFIKGRFNLILLDGRTRIWSPLSVGSRSGLSPDLVNLN